MASGSRKNGAGFYLTLEVAPTASHDEIVRAYRRLAHGAHPDADPRGQIPQTAARLVADLLEAWWW